MSNLPQQTVYPADPVENQKHIEYITEQIKGVRLNAARDVMMMPYVWGPGVILRAPAHMLTQSERGTFSEEKEMVQVSTHHFLVKE